MTRPHRKRSRYIFFFPYAIAWALIFIALVELNNSSSVKTGSPFDRRLGRIDLDGERLENSLDRLGKEAGVKIDVDWPALDALHLPRHRPVFLHLEGATLGSALAAILYDRSGRDNDVLLQVTATAIHITTKMEEERAVCIYDISDVIDRDYEIHGRDQKLTGIGTLADSPMTLTREDCAKRTIVFLRNQIEADTALSAFRFEVVGSQLIVLHGRCKQKETAALLADLRAAMGTNRKPAE